MQHMANRPCMPRRGPPKIQTHAAIHVKGVSGDMHARVHRLSSQPASREASMTCAQLDEAEAADLFALERALSASAVHRPSPGLRRASSSSTGSGRHAHGSQYGATANPLGAASAPATPLQRRGSHRSGSRLAPQVQSMQRGDTEAGEDRRDPDDERGQPQQSVSHQPGRAVHWGSSQSESSQEGIELQSHLSSVAEQPVAQPEATENGLSEQAAEQHYHPQDMAEQPAAQPGPAENGHAHGAEAAQRQERALECQVATPFQTLSMARRTSSSLHKDSPVWRPGELGGPGGRLQTISMLPRGQVGSAIRSCDQLPARCSGCMCDALPCAWHDLPGGTAPACIGCPALPQTDLVLRVSVLACTSYDASLTAAAPVCRCCRW